MLIILEGRQHGACGDWEKQMWKRASVWRKGQVNSSDVDAYAYNLTFFAYGN
jgi:hypothetical protein